MHASGADAAGGEPAAGLGATGRTGRPRPRRSSTPMRIAMVAPLMEAIPPQAYGGTERVVSLLTEELVRRGHQVALFASGDSQTRAELVPCCPRGLRLDPEVTDYVAYTMTQLGTVYARAEDFDV